MSKLVSAIRPDVRANPARPVSPMGRVKESSSANCRVTPTALYFPPPMERVVRNEVTIANLSATTGCVYRVRCNDPHSFTTAPRSGVVAPGRATRVLIGNVPPSRRPTDSGAATIPLDGRRFKITVRMVPPEHAGVSDVNELWKLVEGNPVELEVSMPVFYSDAVPPNVTLLVPTTSLNVSQEAPSLGTSLTMRENGGGMRGSVNMRNVTFSTDSRPPSSMASPSRRTPTSTGSEARRVSPHSRTEPSEKGERRPVSPTPQAAKRPISPRKAAEGIVTSSRLQKAVSEDVDRLREKNDTLIRTLREAEEQNAALQQQLQQHSQKSRAASASAETSGMYVATLIFLMIVAYIVGITIDRELFPVALRDSLRKAYSYFNDAPFQVAAAARDAVKRIVGNRTAA